MWSEIRMNEATKHLMNAPLIITFVDYMICRYLGDTTCVFIISLSVGRARHEIADIGIQMNKMIRIWLSSKYGIVSPSISE